MSKIDKDITATVTNAPDLQQGHPPAPVAPAAPAPKPRAKKAAAKVAAPKLLANLPKPTLETVALDKIQDRRDTRRADETANAFNGSYLASKTYFGCDLPPLTLNRVEGELSVVDGQRRLQALRDCEATECEAWIYDGLSDQQVRVLTQILNLNRLDLDALDKALLIKTLVDAGGLQKDKRALVGLKKSQVSDLFALANAPELHDAVKNKTISVTDAAELAKLKRQHPELDCSERIKWMTEGDKKKSVKELRKAVKAQFTTTKSDTEGAAEDVQQGGEEAKVEVAEVVASKAPEGMGAVNVVVDGNELTVAALVIEHRDCAQELFAQLHDLLAVSHNAQEGAAPEGDTLPLRMAA